MSKSRMTKAKAAQAPSDSIDAATAAFSWRDAAPERIASKARAKVEFTPDLAADYVRLFLSCEVDRDRFTEVKGAAAAIVSNKSKYAPVEQELGVPWFFVGLVHNLESGFDFHSHLHNGDPLSARTIHPPAGRPTRGKPPYAWSESAIDALEVKGLGQWTDWTIAGSLYQLERYNGFGYRFYHSEVLSPYLWGGTCHYKSGKYDLAGKWDPKLASRQCGAAAVLKLLIETGAVTLEALPAPEGADEAIRVEAAAVSAAQAKIGRKLDAYPDRVDSRDWFYRPSLRALPDRVVNIHRVPGILDQGQEGACTGFALAASINFLLADRAAARRVSPRMLYEMARRYDEWPGEEYDGSSARGAMKGWISHGVCADTTWPHNLFGPQHLDMKIGAEARGTPGGAYYRVMHREIRDMHAALAETGILFITLMVHAGWDTPGLASSGSGSRKTVPISIESTDAETAARTIRLPVIQRVGRADGGHAVAIVGYTDAGFIIQNSWGAKWGWKGFALLPYEDYLLHAVDVWVAQLGVPIALENWSPGAEGDAGVGMQRAVQAVPLDEIRPFVINLGNNGKLSGSGQYWTTVKDIERLFHEEIPARIKKENWPKCRILLYLHGGLNSETDAARRALSYRDVCLANQIYPVFIMWETGEKETILSAIGDLFTRDDERAGGFADFWRKTREALVEAKDLSLELTAAAPGTLMWDEMKENARLASVLPDGGMRILVEQAIKALASQPPIALSQFELHVVGHSAGAIFAAHALDLLLRTGIPLKTLQFLAPAVTVELFKEKVLPHVATGRAPKPVSYNLTDELERGDTCWIYEKSLLYLVSNAFEHRRGRPLLGMDRFVQADRDLKRLFSDGNYVLAEQPGDPNALSKSRSHGGFDADPATLNSVLRRIVGKNALAREFKDRDLKT